MIVCSGEFTKIQTGKEFACYCGVVPFEHSSGTSVRVRPRVCHWANKKLKKYLHMAAIWAIQVEGELKAYYQRQVGKGKDKLSVLNALRNKLVVRVCACKEIISSTIGSIAIRQLSFFKKLAPQQAMQNRK